MVRTRLSRTVRAKWQDHGSLREEAQTKPPPLLGRRYQVYWSPVASEPDLLTAPS